MKKILAAFILVLVCAGYSYATEEKTYLGVSLALFDYSEDYVSEDFNPVGIIGRAGYLATENFGIEGRLGFGLAENEKFINNVKVSLELDNLLGIYGKGIYNLNDKANFYGLLGFSRIEGTVKAGTISQSSNDSGLSFGVGFGININPIVGIGVEYMNYLSKSDYDISSLEFNIFATF